MFSNLSKFLVISFFFVLISHSSFGQYGSIKGEIKNSFGEPEFMVIIQLDGENIRRPDLEGNFEIDSIPIGEHIISARSNMYPDTVEVPILIKDGELSQIQIEYPVCENANNTKKCPVCRKTKHVIPIVYGLPASGLIEQEKQGKVVLGGCLVSYCDPNWFCKKDKIRF